MQCLSWRPRSLPALLLLFLLLPTTAFGQAVWYDSAWTHRLALTARPEMIVDGELYSDITLLLELDGSQHGHLFATARTDGADLVVTSSNGTTVLGHEVVSYDATAQTAEIWFKVPVLSDADNRFYLYYGNPAGATPPVQGAAWTTLHQGVFHFEQNPAGGVLADYGPHDNDGTMGPGTNWVSSDLRPGKLGKAWFFNGQDHFIDGDAVASPDSNWTISAWFANWNLNVDANFALSAEVGFWHLSSKRNGEQKYSDIATKNGYIRWNPALNDSLLHLMVWTLDAEADTARFYFDGVEQTISVRYCVKPPFKVYTGNQLLGQIGIAGPIYANNPFDQHEGLVDEFQIYRGIRSPKWIRTEYNNQSDALAFFTYEVQTPATPVGPLAQTLIALSASPNPLRAGVAAIDVDPGDHRVRVAVYDLAGRRVRELSPEVRSAGPFRLHWDGRDDSGHDVGNGIYFVKAQGPGVSAGAKLVLLR